MFINSNLTVPSQSLAWLEGDKAAENRNNVLPLSWAKLDLYGGPPFAVKRSFSFNQQITRQHTVKF